MECGVDHFERHRAAATRYDKISDRYRAPGGARLVRRVALPRRH
jgi:hypothetical protein